MEEEKKNEQNEQEKQSVLLELTQLNFLLGLDESLVNKTKKNKIESDILKHIKDNNMLAFYKNLGNLKKLTKYDNNLEKKMSKNNENKLKELEEKYKDAKENHGETEIREALLAKADFFSLTNTKEKAIEAYKETLKATVGSGGRIDIVFSILRVSIFWNDMKLIRTYINEAKKFVEKGGDWERRNRLKIYEATYKILIREFKDAADLFLDSVATFTCYDLYSYETFIFYTVISSIISLNRITLKEKVINSPEILTVIRDIPHLKPLITSLYKCHYKDFFISLKNITPQILSDCFFAPHFAYFLREIRIVAYSQFLRSYRSVTIKSMSQTFGVSEKFLDNELSKFISAHKLSAKIDKVDGIIETNRRDARNSQYQETIKRGDALLTRVQKLSKILVN